jgi:hypothetical protein
MGEPKCIVLNERSRTQKVTLLYDSIYMTSLQRQTFRDRIFPSAGVKGGDYKWIWGTFWHSGNLLHLDYYMTIYICQTHQSVDLKMVNFTVCNLYIHIPDFKKKKSHVWEEASPFLSLNKTSTYVIWICSSMLGPWEGANLEGHTTHWRQWNGKNCWLLMT